MIYVFLDEAGSFECNDRDKTKQDIIGGVICKGIKSEKYVEKLSNSIKSVFINHGGDDYYNNIHGRQRNGKVQNDILKDIFKNKKYRNKIIPFYIEKGHINKKVYSNITDDNRGSFLYLNMMNRVVSNLLLYKSGIIDDDNEMVINLPTRTLPIRVLSRQKREDFKELACDITDKMVSLNISDNLISALGYEIDNCNFLKNKIYIKINVNTIKYGNKCKIENSNGNCLNVFYQLADFVCNNAYLKVINNLNEIVFYYDDIDESYRNIIKYYNQGKLYEYINEKEKYNTKFKNSKYKKMYDLYIKDLDEERLYNRASIKDFINKEREEIDSKEYNRVFVKRKFAYIDKYITNTDIKDNLETIIEYYIYKMRIYNHLGDFKDNKITYEQIINLNSKYKVNSLDMVKYRMISKNLYAVTLSNAFLFEKSIQHINDNIKYQEIIEEMYKEISCDIDGNSTPKNYYDIDMGKYLSSKGQYMSFINDISSKEYFLKALDCFKYNKMQKDQTISYLIHYYAYFNIIPEECIRKIINEYFEFNDFEEGINYFRKMEFEDLLLPSQSFKLFAFIKYWIIYEKMGQTIVSSKIKELSNKLNKLCLYIKKSSKTLEHPYELIFYNIAQKLESGTLKKQLNEKAISICENPNSEFALRAIGFMIKFNSYKNKKDLRNFVKFLSNEDILDDTRKYFEVDTLSKEDDMDRALNIVNSKFTYMYR
jgi:hypothetical protein